MNKFMKYEDMETILNTLSHLSCIEIVKVAVLYGRIDILQAMDISKLSLESMTDILHISIAENKIQIFLYLMRCMEKLSSTRGCIYIACRAAGRYGRINILNQLKSIRSHELRIFFIEAAIAGHVYVFEQLRKTYLVFLLDPYIYFPVIECAQRSFHILIVTFMKKMKTYIKEKNIQSREYNAISRTRFI